MGSSFHAFQNQRIPLFLGDVGYLKAGRELYSVQTAFLKENKGSLSPVILLRLHS